MTRAFHYFGLATLALAAQPGIAATPPAAAAAKQSTDTEAEPIQTGVFTSRWGRLFSGNDNKFSGALSFNSGLKDQWVTIPNSSDTASQTNKINQTVNLSMQYSPWSFLFANVTLRAPVRDFSRYTSDFRYSFGYDDWHANTFSLVYSNYGDNHIWPSGNKRRTYFEQGGVTAAYKFSLPKPLEKHLLINKGDSIICQVGYTWVPRYYDLASNGIRSNKNVVLGGCGYTYKQHYFVRATAFWYPESSQQQPWNGDYSYSFGYAGYKPGTFSIQYANYSGTRYPGHASGNGKFREGTVSLIWYLPL